MITRLYVHNFRCLENFELPIAGKSSALLIGKNGSGKTTVGLALEILQRIARGTNRVGDLVKPKDLTGARTDVPTRFEIEVELDRRIYSYVIILGAWTDPEGLRAVLGSYETIGLKLAKDCREETNHFWGHRLLQHNLSEIDRLRRSVRTILFPSND